MTAMPVAERMTAEEYPGATGRSAGAMDGS